MVEVHAIARQFLEEMQACVRAVDFLRARPLFAEDAIGFGTYAAVVHGRDRIESDQWRQVWPRIKDFTFRLDELECLGGEATLCVIVTWDSLGTRPDGSTFPRPGRATLLLEPRNGRWVATHSHFSLAPGTTG